MFKRLLIANRGEIACRIIHTAKRLGITCVAIYSEADANALHVKMADEAHCVGTAAASDSYLAIEKIIAIAQFVHADAIHPGYGFLAENADFAAACEAAHIIFVGPSSAAIRLMGSKDQAKKTVQQVGVPIVPTFFNEKNNDAALPDFIAVAEKIGYPVILKAVAGGGGKGMRLITNKKEFEPAWLAARREAQSSFGNSAMMLEKYISPARHIEVQLFGDQQGNYAYLFERDCSLQRRHQKILEEALAPYVANELRQTLGEIAIKVASAINYINAGTIEFLLDDQNNFYFMEMNTRLQVEHAVTEMITGQDLVEWQLRIACGENLPLKQAELKHHGRAIEARIYAEDPNKDFLPSTGYIKHLQFPQANQHVQIHTSIQLQDKISIHYDPMLAKLVVWGKDRKAALQQLLISLNQFQLVGVTSNIDFLKAVVQHPAYQVGKYDTHFIKTHEKQLLQTTRLTTDIMALASLYVLLKQNEKPTNESNSPWLSQDNWRPNLTELQQLKFLVNDQAVIVVVEKLTTGFNLYINNEHSIVTGSLSNNQITLNSNGKAYSATAIQFDDELHLFYQDQHFILGLPNAPISAAQLAHGNHQLISPMPGTVVAVFVQAGQTVKKGERLVAIEAMKMEHTLLAPTDGIIKEIFHGLGMRVEEGQKLLQFDS